MEKNLWTVWREGGPPLSLRCLSLPPGSFYSEETRSCRQLRRINQSARRSKPLAVSRHSGSRRRRRKNNKIRFGIPSLSRARRNLAGGRGRDRRQARWCRPIGILGGVSAVLVLSPLLAARVCCAEFLLPGSPVEMAGGTRRKRGARGRAGGRRCDRNLAVPVATSVTVPA